MTCFLSGGVYDVGVDGNNSPQYFCLSLRSENNNATTKYSIYIYLYSLCLLPLLCLIANSSLTLVLLAATLLGLLSVGDVSYNTYPSHKPHLHFLQIASTGTHKTSGFDPIVRDTVPANMEPTEYSADAGGGRGGGNQDLGGSGTIILSNDEVLAMTRNSTISIGSVLESTKMPSKTMDMKKQDQQEEDNRRKQQERELRQQAIKQQTQQQQQQQQQQNQKKEPQVQQQLQQRKSDSQVIASTTSGTKSEKEKEDEDRLCVTLSNDEILAITRSDSVATAITGGSRTSSSRISTATTATVDPMLLEKEKEKNARLMQNHPKGTVGGTPKYSHTTKTTRASTKISPSITTKGLDIGTTPLLEPSSPATAATASATTSNNKNNSRKSTSTTTTVTAAPTKSGYSSVAAASSSTSTTTRLSPIMGLADKKNFEKISGAAANVSRISVSPSRASRRSRHYLGGERQRSISPTTVDENDRSPAGKEGTDGRIDDDGGVGGDDNKNTAATAAASTTDDDDQDLQPQILPGAVRVAGIGKTNTKDSIIALFPGVEEEEDSMFLKEDDDGIGSSKLMKSASKEDQKSTEFALSNRISGSCMVEDGSKKIGSKEDTTNTTPSSANHEENNNDGTVTAKAISQEELEQEVLQKYHLQPQQRQQDQKSRDVENQQVLVPEAAMAVIVTEEELNSGRGSNRTWLICGSILITIIAIVVVVVVVLGNNGDGGGSSADLVHGDSHDDVDDHLQDHDSHDDEHGDGDHSIGLPTSPTLQRIQERGYLKCRASPEDITAGHGITVELVSKTKCILWNLAMCHISPTTTISTSSTSALQ